MFSARVGPDFLVSGEEETEVVVVVYKRSYILVSEALAFLMTSPSGLNVHCVKCRIIWRLGIHFFPITEIKVL